MSYLQRFPYEQLRQLQSDVETLNQLVANLTKRLNDATQYFVTDIDTSDRDAPFRPHEYRTSSAIVRFFLQRSHSFPRKQGDSAISAGVVVRTKFS